MHLLSDATMLSPEAKGKGKIQSIARNEHALAHRWHRTGQDIDVVRWGAKALPNPIAKVRTILEIVE